ncbi:hypothetical protein BCON_0024g00280 [Botryotinia convoluta]|uniref:Uncharacterized protein n=1 Tax=Botryotinia convoluta TaxID=54673 RepID=A0A4Z1IK82_9HELO|nr:hypothetical protein BCON_0024g00280 [Botryotinia convoluta]
MLLLWVTVSIRTEDGLISLPGGQAIRAKDILDEFNCLNPNITTLDGTKEVSSLPVMTCIHGSGGWGGTISN